jgi:hypothetical protein
MPLGILSGEKDSGILEQQASSIKDRFKQLYQGVNNAGDIAITSAAMKWNQIGLSPVDLNIIQSKEEILESGAINSFNIHTKEMEEFESFLPENKESLKIIITSGASCPDAVVDGVLQRIIDLTNPPISIADSLTAFLKNEVAS